MEIKIEGKSFNIDDGEFEMILTVRERLHKDFDYSFGREMRERVLNRVSKELTMAFVEKYTDEIIGKVDINSIVKQIQLRTIGHLSADPRQMEGRF